MEFSLIHGYYFYLAVICFEKMNPNAIFAEGDAGYDIGLHSAAIVVIDFANFLVLRMMRVPTEDDIGAFFARVSCGAFSDGIDSPHVMFAIVF